MVIHVNKTYFSYYNRDGNENIIVVKEIDVSKQIKFYIFLIYRIQGETQIYRHWVGNVLYKLWSMISVYCMSVYQREQRLIANKIETNATSQSLVPVTISFSLFFMFTSVLII